MSGVGTQFLAIISGILLMALLGMFNVHRHGSINAAAILLYAFTSCELFHSFTALSLACLLTPRSQLHVSWFDFVCLSTLKND